MSDKAPDSAPRSYPPMVSRLRRGERDPNLPEKIDPSELEPWLLEEAAGENDLLSFFQSFLWRLVAAGYPLDRASLHVGTLHPELFGYAWNWNRDDGFCDEVKVNEAVLATDAYRRNPLFRVIEYGEAFRGQPGQSGANEQSPLMAELAQKGITDYAAVPLRSGGAYHNAATVATKRPEGFTNGQFADIRRLLSLLALHVERHIATRISENVLNTYLGVAAGRQVLQGSIKRGSGAPIEAIIWVSDMRGFTDLADRLDDRDMLSVLNAYFDRLVGAVMEARGEVLKFIGDGLLAVFPFSDFESEQAAANAALHAAQDAIARLNQLNGDDDALPGIDGWRPLHSGISLHKGDVFFGNLGAPKRLDFTVIGRAVNTASRVEGLCKAMGRQILITEPVAGLLDVPLEPLGSHDLRGLKEALALFAPRVWVNPRAK